ncbi:hypothetical protein, partial [Rhizobium johnstonii]|uniref:hypothetical protein n=1 Tax=Rhizobium johnstonii TaxID=3019933 RepID=UPI003F976D9A
ASDDLVMLKPQQIDAETGKSSEPAVFTTRDILRIEYDMARSAQVLSEHRGFAFSDRVVAAAVRNVETRDTDTSFQRDPEQVDAVRHVTRDNG